MKGSDRNKPCSCGSGLKAKRCEHPKKTLTEDLGIQVLRPNDVLEVDEPRPRRRGLSPLMLAAIAGMLEVPPARR